MRLVPFALAVPVALAACATTPAADEPRPRFEGTCSADAAQHLLGQMATAELGAELLRVTGARVIRWVPPRTAVTMDFRADRLTVSYDDAMLVTQISCT